MGLGLAGGFAAGFAERSSQRIASEKEQMWAEEQNMINTMLPIALKNRHERMMERKGMKDTFNQLKQYMSDDSAFSVMGQGAEFSKGFLEDIQKEQARLGRVFKDENDLRESGMLDFKTTADLAGVRANYEKSGRTFNDFMDQYVGKPTADPSVNQNQIAEDLIRHYGKIPGFENTVKNSAYRKMAATMGISPEDVSSYVSGEYTTSPVTADMPIARRAIDKQLQNQMEITRIQLETQKFLFGRLPEKENAALELSLAQAAKYRAEAEDQKYGLSSMQQKWFGRTKQYVSGAQDHLARLLGGSIEEVGAGTERFKFTPNGGELQGGVEKKLRWTTGTPEYKKMMQIYNAATVISVDDTNKAIFDGGKYVTENEILKAGHSLTLGGQAYLMVTAAASLDAGHEGTPYMNLLTDLLPNITQQLSTYDPINAQENPNIPTPLTISMIQGTVEQYHEDNYNQLSEAEKAEILKRRRIKIIFDESVQKVSSQLLPTNQFDDQGRPIKDQGLTFNSVSTLIKDEDGLLLKEAVKNTIANAGIIPTSEKEQNRLTEQFYHATELINNNLKQYRGLSEEELKREYINIKKAITEPLNEILNLARIGASPRGEGSPTLEADVNTPTLIEKLGGATEEGALSIGEPNLAERSSNPQTVQNQIEKWRKLDIRDLPEGHPRRMATSLAMSDEALATAEKIFAKKFLEGRTR